MSLKVVTRQEGSSLSENNEAILYIWPSQGQLLLPQFARLKAWRIFLKTAQKLLNQITAVTGLITIEYLLILSLTEITDVS